MGKDLIQGHHDLNTFNYISSSKYPQNGKKHSFCGRWGGNNATETFEIAKFFTQGNQQVF